MRRRRVGLRASVGVSFWSLLAMPIKWFTRDASHQPRAAAPDRLRLGYEEEEEKKEAGAEVDGGQVHNWHDKTIHINGKAIRVVTCDTLVLAGDGSEPDYSQALETCRGAAVVMLRGAPQCLNAFFKRIPGNLMSVHGHTYFDHDLMIIYNPAIVGFAGETLIELGGKVLSVSFNIGREIVAFKNIYEGFNPQFDGNKEQYLKDIRALITPKGNEQVVPGGHYDQEVHAIPPQAANPGVMGILVSIMRLVMSPVLPVFKQRLGLPQAELLPAVGHAAPLLDHDPGDVKEGEAPISGAGNVVLSGQGQQQASYRLNLNLPDIGRFLAGQQPGYPYPHEREGFRFNDGGGQLPQVAQPEQKLHNVDDGVAPVRPPLVAYGDEPRPGEPQARHHNAQEAQRPDIMQITDRQIMLGQASLLGLTLMEAWPTIKYAGAEIIAPLLPWNISTPSIFDNISTKKINLMKLTAYVGLIYVPYDVMKNNYLDVNTYKKIAVTQVIGFGTQLGVRDTADYTTKFITNWLKMTPQQETVLQCSIGILGSAYISRATAFMPQAPWWQNNMMRPGIVISAATGLVGCVAGQKEEHKAVSAKAIPYIADIIAGAITFSKMQFGPVPRGLPEFHRATKAVVAGLSQVVVTDIMAKASVKLVPSGCFKAIDDYPRPFLEIGTLALFEHIGTTIPFLAAHAQLSIPIYALGVATIANTIFPQYETMSENIGAGLADALNIAVCKFVTSALPAYASTLLCATLIVLSDVPIAAIMEESVPTGGNADTEPLGDVHHYEGES